MIRFTKTLFCNFERYNKGGYVRYKEAKAEIYQINDILAKTRRSKRTLDKKLQRKEALIVSLLRLLALSNILTLSLVLKAVL